MSWLHARTLTLWAVAFALTGLPEEASTEEGSATAKTSGRSQEFRQNFNFSNTDLRSAFKAISATGKIDIVLSPTVTGTVSSLQLSDKTWQEAMMVLCQMFDLKYTAETNYLYVQTMAEFNKNSVENATVMQQNGSLAPLIRDVIKLKSAKAKDLEESVRGLLSSRGKLNVVERNNAMLIFDTRQNILEIREAVKELDIETYQVNIQAELIQVDADATREMGVDWQFFLRNGYANLANTPGKIPSSPSNNLVGQTNQGGQALQPSTGGASTTGGSGTGTGTTTTALGGVAGATTALAFGLFDGHLGVAIANLLKNANGEVLAKPQITTLDNTQATIFMGEQVPIKVLDVNGRQAVQLEDAGTSLTVTPHVTSDGRVLLDLNPEKNSFRNDAAAGVVLQKQSAKTTVLVNDGETVVIAGLTTKEETESETGVPLLMDIPILGWLFKHKATVTSKRDLIIFVTPHVVRTGTANKDNAVSASSLDENLSTHGVYGDLPAAKVMAAPVNAGGASGAKGSGTP